MFNKILVANRGEIACRIIKTCRKLGIKTVAVYSDADKHSKHVSMADECYYLGSAPASESYLRIDKLVQACKDTKANAVHPGYGFLSEKPKFVKALEENQITFIGPNSYSMTQMGDKIESKAIAKAAGVFTIPGFKGQIDSLDQAITIANEIKYPIMLKASAGGGGKGMRICWNDEDTREFYPLTKSESLNAFGDDRLLVEKYIEHPRHVEIQLMGDQFGNYIYLPERECSIQRRNQKVIEEAPSTHIDKETRKRMGEQAVMLARQVKYHSAGTVEFLVDKNKQFYFLEMNTRLQVEHPITELVTNLDLVELMINVANKQKLPLAQKDVQCKGHAIEARVYAEDANYMPSIGTLTKYVEPRPLVNATSTNLIRCDSGIEEGSAISMYYDPMICKLCTYSPTRQQSTLLMQQALSSYIIKGVHHNIELLSHIVHHPEWNSGNTTTDFLPTYLNEQERQKLTILTPTTQTLLQQVALSIQLAINKRDYPNSTTSNNYYVQINDNVPQLVSSSTIKVDWELEQPLIFINNNKSTIIMQYSDPSALGFTLIYKGQHYLIKVLTELQKTCLAYMKEKVAINNSHLVESPMPGKVVDVMVKEGDQIGEGKGLLILEAMKMQNVLKSQQSGKIKRVLVKKDQIVSADELLIEFEQ